MSAEEASAGNRLRGWTAPLLAALAVACCLFAPVILGGLGSVAIGGVLGVGAGLIGLVVCLTAFLILRKRGRRC